MRRWRARTARAFRWTLLIVSLSLPPLWLASGFIGGLITFRVPRAGRLSLGVFEGLLVCASAPSASSAPTLTSQWTYPGSPGSLPPVWQFWFALSHWPSPYGAGTLHLVEVPLWAILLALTVPTVHACRGHWLNRYGPDHCRRCGYHLAGLQPRAVALSAAHVRFGLPPPQPSTTPRTSRFWVVG